MLDSSKDGLKLEAMKRIIGVRLEFNIKLLTLNIWRLPMTSFSKSFLIPLKIRWLQKDGMHLIYSQLL